MFLDTPGILTGKDIEAVNALLADLMKSKPASSKGVFLQKLSVSSTMGVGINVDQSSLPV